MVRAGWIFRKCRALLKGGQQLDLVRYLTTRARNDPAAAKRRSSFIDRGHATVGTGELIGVAPRRRGRVAGWARRGSSVLVAPIQAP